MTEYDYRIRLTNNDRTNSPYSLHILNCKKLKIKNSKNEIENDKCKIIYTSVDSFIYLTAE